MKTKNHIVKLFYALALALLPMLAIAQSKKTLVFPKNIGRVGNNDFNNDSSKYSFKRSVLSDNIAVFWAKSYGQHPEENTDSKQRFNVNRVLSELEHYYNFYIDSLHVLKKGKSISDKHKALVFIFDGEEATAYGGGQDSVAILWTPAVRINKEPFGVLAHELGHSFQFMAGVDAGASLNGSIGEMGAQYLLWNIFPDWVDFEAFHIKAFLKQPNLAFLSTTNQYHSPFLLEYWAEKHGFDFYGKLLGAVQKRDDAVMDYKRLTGIDQNQFNDEVFDASRKMITWDFKRVGAVTAKYANKYSTHFNKGNNGWFAVDSLDCPQNYGFNGIALQVPTKNKKVKVSFKGIAGADGYRKIEVDKAGWRYGFLAVKENGERVYGKMFNKAGGEASFKVPNKTKFLWLVVTGAPTTHKKLGRDEKQFAQWPYQIKLSGTVLL